MNQYYEPWTERAVCRETDPEAFYPEKTSDPHDLITARRICMFTCPVRQDCLDSAMRREQGLGRASRFGLWGGLTPRARAAFEADWLDVRTRFEAVA